MVRSLPSLDELASRLVRGAAEYQALKQQTESQVARWVWATGPIHSLNPGFDAKTHGREEGKELAAEPVQRARHFHYGFDAAGRPVVVRYYSDTDGHFTEQFFTYHDGYAERWSFGPHPQYKDLDAVAHYVFDGPRVVGYISLHAQGESFVETYEYDGDRLRTLRRTGSNPAIGGTYHHDYDAAGRISTITMEANNGKRGVVYQRPTRSLPVLLKEVKARLLDLIPKRVAALSSPGPAFGLALVYDPGSALSMLPPKLAVGLESERESWRTSGAAREALWDAQGFSTFDHDRLEFDDPALLADTGEMANHLRSAEGMDKAHKLLVDVAKELNKTDWSAVAKVTPDFVVYPVDLHLEHLDRDMASAVPAAKLKALKARKEL
jgi:hypothetical protein